MLNLNKLEVFAAIVRTGSFSAAAQSLLLTQPAVSQHVRDLEAGLGVRLFERNRRGVTLTPEGERLYEYTRAILKLVAEAENAVTDVRQLAGGQIDVGATPGISAYLLPEPIQEFHRRYPNLNAIIQTATTPQIVADLRAGKLDLGLVEGELQEWADAAIGVQPLDVVEQGVVIGPQHPWWRREAVALAEMGGQTWVMRQRNSQTRIWLDALLQEHQLAPRIGAEFDNLESIKRAVANSTHITVLPEYAVAHEVEIGRLCWLPVTGETLQRTLKLVWNRQVYFSPIVRAFLDCMRLCLPQLAPEELE